MRLKWALWIVLGLLFVGWVVELGCYPLVMWSPINCRYDDIDITSGRIRRQSYRLGLCVSEEFEESFVSRELGEVDAKSEWHRVNTFSPMVNHSPNGRYHSAIHNLDQLDKIADMAALSPEAKKTIVGNILDMWQDRPRDIDDYVQEIGQIAVKRSMSRDATPITADELPKPPQVEPLREE